MEGNIIPPDFSAGENIQWRGSTGDFVEFVMLLTDFNICINEQMDKEYGKLEFDNLCDALGNSLLNVFSIDISPFTSFDDLRKNTRLSYQFTKRVVKQLEQLKEDEQFYILLEEKGITPSYEVMADEIIKWKNTEKLATFLWLYLKIEF